VGRDPLDILGDLPNWPGKTAPKNRPTSPKKIKSEEELNGARATIFRIGGEEREMFTIGELARAVERKPVTIRAWESQGVIPRANYRTPVPKGQQIPGKTVKGRRLYSRAQVEFLAEAVKKFPLTDKRTAQLSRFKAYVIANWPK